MTKPDEKLRLDAFDLNILALLQENTRITSEDIGIQIGLSATACQRRMKRLRETGIIEKEMAVLNGLSFGGYVTVIVDIIMKHGGAATMNKFKQQMMCNQAVQQCFYVTGSSDFVVIIVARNMLHYEQLTQALFYNNENIKKFTSTVVMENVKVGLTIPLPE